MIEIKNLENSGLFQENMKLHSKHMEETMKMFEVVSQKRELLFKELS